MEEEKSPQMKALIWMKEFLTKGMENITAKGLEFVHVGNGVVRCNLIIPDLASDADGNWHAGAIAALIDMIGAVVICSATGTTRAPVTMDFSISYYSSAKVKEKVGIEAKIIGNKGKLTSVAVEIRRKDDGELIAVGKQWTASNEFRAPLDRPSKL